MKLKKKPIFHRIMLLMSILILIEILLLIGSIFGNGVIDRLNQNAQDILEERVINRRNYLENEMVGNWSNLDSTVQTVNDITARLIEQGDFSMEQLESGNSDTCEPLMKEMSGALVSLMRNNRVTGAYVVLNTDDLNTPGDVENKPGIYIRDLDPDSGSSERNLDLLLERAPAFIVSDTGISTDSCWRPRYEFSRNNKYDSLFYEPFQKSYDAQADSDNYQDYGYWSQEYTLYGDSREAISYSVPLILEDGTVYGVLGIDLTLDYLKKILPYSELFENKMGAYVLAVEKEEAPTYEDVFVNGPIYESYKKTSHIGVVSQGSSEQTVKDGESEFYFNVQKLNIYNSNTPFSDQQWILAGGVRTVDLFSFSEQISHILMIAIVLTLLTGIGGSFLISRIVSRPIAMLCRNLNFMQQGENVHLNRTGIAEIDRLALAIEVLNQEVIDSATKFEQIINMASVHIGGFEYNYKENTFFITKGFFEVFGEHNNPTTIDELKNYMQGLKTYIVLEDNNETLFEIPSESGNAYIKMKYKDDGVCWIGLVEDVTQTVLEKDRIKYERDHDLLTGLINRRAFYSILRRMFEETPKKLKIAALVMMDLDNLKNINDTYGHDWGDKYIQCAARCFRELAPDAAIVSRISGDEFYIFFYGYDGKDEIRGLINTLRNGIGEQKIELPNRKKFSIKVTGGIAWYPDDSDSYEELLKLSDFAMYKIKQTGRGRVSEFDVEIYKKEAYLLQNREELTILLEKAMVQYHFQPIVDAFTGEIFAYEALMRIDMPTLHTPDEVITLARLEGKLDQVEVLTWYKALEAYAEHLRLNSVSSQCKVFINSISNQVLSIETLSRIEKKFGHMLNHVVCEMTEDEQLDAAVIQHKKMIISHWKGAIALDDYGSGYNTEKNLLALNPQYIKIDMGIIRDINKSSDKQKIVQNVISYAHERGMKLVAEGVETKEEARVVIAMGVDYIQGYLTGKPALDPPKISEEIKEFIINC